MTNRKVLLVHPEISRTRFNFAGIIDNEPLELEYLSAELKKRGYSIAFWDGQVELQPFVQRLVDFAPDVVYVCGRTRQESFMLEYCAAAKSKGAMTLVGGIHAQLCPERFFCDSVDYVVTSFDPTVAASLIDGERPSSSYCTCDGNRWRTFASEPAKLEAFPLPDRSCFAEHSDRYRYLELLPCAHVRTSLSCMSRCSFCYRNTLNCGVYSERSIESVVDEISQIDCENIYIIDDNFLNNPDRVRSFITLVRERGLNKRFVCYGRADFIAAHPDIISDLKSIGFYYILVGLEAIDDERLKQYNKRTRTSCNEKCVRILNESGINIMAMFIVGLDFKHKDFTKLYDWICSHDIRHSAVSIYTPELAYALSERFDGKLVTTDPSAWDYLHVVAEPKHMSVSRFYLNNNLLMLRLFLKGRRDGIYDFINYGYFIRSIAGKLNRFGG